MHPLHKNILKEYLEITLVAFFHHQCTSFFSLLACDKHWLLYSFYYLLVSRNVSIALKKLCPKFSWFPCINFGFVHLYILVPWTNFDHALMFFFLNGFSQNAFATFFWKFSHWAASLRMVSLSGCYFWPIWCFSVFSGTFLQQEFWGSSQILMAVLMQGLQLICIYLPLLTKTCFPCLNVVYSLLGRILSH